MGGRVIVRQSLSYFIRDKITIIYTKYNEGRIDDSTAYGQVARAPARKVLWSTTSACASVLGSSRARPLPRIPPLN